MWRDLFPCNADGRFRNPNQRDARTTFDSGHGAHIVTRGRPATKVSAPGTDACRVRCVKVARQDDKQDDDHR